MKGDSQRRQAAEGAKTRLRVLEAVTAYIHENGYGPSFDDIAEVTGLSRTQCSRHVALLIEEGLLRGKPGVHRAIGLID